MAGRDKRQARLLPFLKLFDPLNNFTRDFPMVLELLPLSDVHAAGDHLHLRFPVEVGPKLAVSQKHLDVIHSCALIVSLLLNYVK